MKYKKRSDYFNLTAFLYMAIDIIPVVISVMAKAVHTPVGPVKKQRIYAQGRMIITYLNRDMTRD